MAMNAVDSGLASAYERHGGPIKAWKHLGKKTGKAVIGKGKDMVNYFKDKIGGMKAGKGAAKAASAGVASQAIRGKMNESRFKELQKATPRNQDFKKPGSAGQKEKIKTMPLKARSSMPLKVDTQRQMVKKMIGKTK